MRTTKLLVFAAMFFLFSCKKKDTVNTTPDLLTPPVPMGTIAFHMHINIGETEADSGLVITNPTTHQKIELDVAQFYMSGIQVYKPDGTAVPVNNAYLLKTIDNEEYVIGEVPTGNYKSISFHVGIDAATNATAPSSHTGVLAAQDPPMWFGTTTQGYVFLNIKGKADTSATHNSNANTNFEYRLGGNSQLKTVQLPSLVESGLSLLTVTSLNTNALPAQFHVICDFGLLLNGTSFKTNNAIATPFNSDSAAVRAISDNILNIFRYEL